MKISTRIILTVLGAIAAAAFFAYNINHALS